MELQIIHPDKTETVDNDWVEVNTPAGNFVIQKGHVPTILTLSRGREVAYQLESGEKKSFVAERGVISVNRNLATLVIGKTK